MGIINMTKAEINKFYNVDRIVVASELAKLSKSYKDNLDTIIVIMKRKMVNPPQPPAWFKEWSANVYEKHQPQWFVDYMNNFRKEIDQKFKDFSKLNSLKYKQ